MTFVVRTQSVVVLPLRLITLTTYIPTYTLIIKSKYIPIFVSKGQRESVRSKRTRT